MASHPQTSSKKRHQNFIHGVDSGIVNNIIEGLNIIELTINHLHRDYHKSLDLNHPIISDSSKSETGGLLDETKAGDELQTTNLDLSLSLSSSNYVTSTCEELSNKPEISAPRLQLSCMSKSNNLDLNVAINEDFPSLVVMGCSRCYVYVMVSEADPKCPKCGASILVDMFRSSSAKRCM